MYRALVWLATGTFAIGTESFLIAGVLPSIAQDLSVSVAEAGHLITAFALTYAIASPVLAALVGHWPREVLLRGAMAVFALGNVAAALAPTYASLMGCRIGLAVCAAVFSPSAAAYASLAVPAEERGRALAIVFGGMTVASVLGVPVATWLGMRFGWRAAFCLVAVLAVVALAGLCLPRPPQPRGAVIPLLQRLAVARRPAIWRSLLVTWLAFAGTFCNYSYIAPLVDRVGGGVLVAALPWILLAYGVAGAIGNVLGGFGIDRSGPQAVISRALAGATLIFAGLAALVTLGPPVWWGPGALIGLLVLWGLVGWQLPTAQQAHLVQNEQHAPALVLSLQASSLYLGVTTGALLGSLALRYGSVVHLAWISAACAGLALIVWSTDRAIAARRPAAA